MHSRALLLLTFGALVVSGCAQLEPRIKALEASASADAHQLQERATDPVPVITSTPGAFLAGAPVTIAEPVLPILKRKVGYHPTSAVSLADVVAWVTQTTGLPVDIAELQPTSVGVGAAAGLRGMAGAPGILGTPGAPGMASGLVQQQTMYSMYLNYDGTLSGLLDVAGNKANAWWEIRDGRAFYYRTKTKTIYLPLIARKFTNNSSISSTSGRSSDGGSSTGGGATPGAATSTSASASNAAGANGGGANSVSDFSVDFWDDIKKTAVTIGAGAETSVNPSAGSVTVTGTPAQVRNVEEWARNLGDQLSQQVSVTVRMYSVRVSKQSNYSWSPNVIFKAASGVLGATITAAQAPSGTLGTPFNVAINAASNAKSGRNTQYSGSQLAFAALSTLGDAVEQMEQTVVTLNGQPAPVQIATDEGYLKSSTTTLTANVGASTTLTPGTVTAGFTALFVPRIVNGKIILGFSMVNSTNNGFTPASSNGSTIQNPNTANNSTQQSVSLTPGDALLLTGSRRDRGSISKSGVGLADNYVFGGGFDQTIGREIIAIVISAQIL